MAKKRLSRREMKHQQKAQQEQIRSRQRWEQQNEPRASKFNAFAPIMGKTEDETLANMMQVLAKSEYLLKEEEFEAVFLPPLESVMMFTQVAEEMGWSPEELVKLERKALNDTHFEIIQNCIPKLLTPGKKQEVLQALQACCDRWQRQGKLRQAGEVSVIKHVLSGKRVGEEVWQLTSLVHGLVARSIAAGFDLADSMGADEVELPSLEQILAETEKSGMVKKAEKLLKRIPGLRRYMEKQADEVWDEGLHAVYEGKLFLGLYEREELQTAVTVMSKLSKSTAGDELTEEALRAMLPQLLKELEAFLDQIFAVPERLAQMRTRVGTILREQKVEPHWMPFIILLQGHLHDDEVVKHGQPFLTTSLIGEVSNLYKTDKTIVHEQADRLSLA